MLDIFAQGFELSVREVVVSSPAQDDVGMAARCVDAGGMAARGVDAGDAGLGTAPVQVRGRGAVPGRSNVDWMLPELTIGHHILIPLVGGGGPSEACPSRADWLR